MQERTIYLTRYDAQRLDAMLEQASDATRDREDVIKLEEELARANVVPGKDVPSNVITMNTQLQLRDEKSGELKTYTLVFPQDANVDEGKISIMSPIGTALIGYCEGDIIEWAVPAGVRRLVVEKILYQPEAAGDFHL